MVICRYRVTLESLFRILLCVGDEMGGSLDRGGFDWMGVFSLQVHF